jgi:hypothetical protein
MSEVPIGADSDFCLDSFFLSHPYGQAVDLLAAAYAAKLVLQVLFWIGAVVFAVVLGLFFKPLRDDVTHARIHIYMEKLKSVSDGDASELKAATLRGRRFFASRPKAEGG